MSLKTRRCWMLLEHCHETIMNNETKIILALPPRSFPRLVGCIGLHRLSTPIQFPQPPIHTISPIKLHSNGITTLLMTTSGYFSHPDPYARYASFPIFGFAHLLPLAFSHSFIPSFGFATRHDVFAFSLLSIFYGLEDFQRGVLVLCVFEGFDIFGG